MVNKDLFVLENFESKLMTRYNIIPSLWLRGGETQPEPAGGWRPRAQPGGPAPRGVAKRSDRHARTGKVRPLGGPFGFGGDGEG